ncbi:hypothetical protein COCC4DRAFT_83122 [Bipolaris maydis ATCC 48331]|uniref:prephenate dehydratase n=2 Tax=Cochliobolus heterostrophus TaxID=5016 RepID=M2UE28_COCH5|nr:uncharacterized protein COCC4DRAFT_83122 [Bipolaris maydis ATCC 48331]EMD91941.1 hypothetical protein COCHEDRAFT_1173316 [Bipolaris maydis C5]KAJ5021446.1 Prephenate dehydratase-domain-containing protein [Bipolaris maydis]ENI02575.1 hypothetical protein COCC4DRAFT_83122 [Bipolaris maydis ATCC 48331]KAJ5061279.1 Prephenate dehydratase-domain-containing protein [Bipolaris maydis]KAJ6198409.1 Prephenate dehydratase-domain-containing protein [Bipolaris maydis]
MTGVEEKPVVAYLGPEGSYTHQAALSTFPPQDPPTTTLTPLTTIQDVFSAVQSGTAHRGVVPFENSSNGSVLFTLDLFADLERKHADILVCDEAYVAVRHCLLGRRPLPAPASTDTPTGKQTNDFSHIKRIYSHPQAWGQCKNFLTTHFRAVEKIDVSSTSRAAQIAAEDETATSAALSSPVAARLFGLQVLAEGVNDRLGNATRFLVLRHRASSSSSSSAAAAVQRSSTVVQGKGDDGDDDDAAWKSLVTFTVQHSNPGALANCLTAFSAQGINLTSINTRPSGDRNWHYVFFVELKGRSRRGHGDGGGGQEEEMGAVDRALEGLGKVCSGYRWLGSWKNRLDEEESG